MSERNPFEQQPKGPETAHRAGRELRCEEWEALLVDALDGLLPAAEEVAFAAHSGECATCAELLAQARQGREWMQFLHTEPEMPGDLLERILSRTSGAVADRPLAVHGAPIPIGPNVLGLPRRRMVWDTRLMMTAAMAFFSIALTLNLAGIRLTNLRLADLTPASVQSNLTRQFYGAKSQVVRYYDNLRFVYEVESKVRELRRDEDTERPAAAQPTQQGSPAAQPGKPGGSGSNGSGIKGSGNSGTGNARKNGGKLERAPGLPQEDVLWGRPMLASGREPRGSRAREFGEHHQAGDHAGADAIEIHKGRSEEVESLVASLRDQAGRSLA